MRRLEHGLFERPLRRWPRFEVRREVVLAPLPRLFSDRFRGLEAPLLVLRLTIRRRAIFLVV